MPLEGILGRRWRLCLKRAQAMSQNTCLLSVCRAIFWMVYAALRTTGVNGMNQKESFPKLESFPEILWKKTSAD